MTRAMSVLEGVFNMVTIPYMEQKACQKAWQKQPRTTEAKKSSKKVKFP
jgi:hypothetical protein